MILTFSKKHVWYPTRIKILNIFSIVIFIPIRIKIVKIFNIVILKKFL